MNEKNSNINMPTQLVVLGATGDLMAKKIVPALFHLFERRELPDSFGVVGVARRGMTDAEFQSFIFEKLSKHKDADIKLCSDFCKLFLYQQGEFQNKTDYLNLQKTLKTIDDVWGICANKLFYLAVPPHFYEIIFRNLSASGLTKPCSAEEGWTPLEINRLRLEKNKDDGGEQSIRHSLPKRSGESLTGWTRIIVEKPFGKDLKTAEELDALLGKFFKEIQIYRVDHYLAKEMLQNILAFRFSNNLFEMNWGNQLIERVHIRLLEKIGAEDRGSFYDGIGALRDVGQNHLLQMLALMTMEHPVAFESEPVRKNRAEIIEMLKIPTEAEIKSSTFRAQYDNFRAIAGVAPDSQTETYFKIRAFLCSPRWRGVPFILESGKRLANQVKEIEVVFRHPMPCLCPKKGENVHYKNRLFIRLEPKERITIEFWSKKPGLTMEIEKRNLDFLFRSEEKKVQYTEEYEKLLLDCIIGDQTLFTSSREVKAMWKFIDPIVTAWQKNKVSLKHYAPDTDSAIAESKFIEEVSWPHGELKKEVGIIGLGKMGANLARRLTEKGWRVVGYNRTSEVTKSLTSEGLVGVQLTI